MRFNPNAGRLDYEQNTLGFNTRMTDIQAAVAYHSYRRLDDSILSAIQGNSHDTGDHLKDLHLPCRFKREGRNYLCILFPILYQNTIRHHEKPILIAITPG